MKSILLFLTFVILIININSNAISRQEPQWDSSEITGYHFHTYFFQENENSNREALSFRYLCNYLIIVFTFIIFKKKMFILYVIECKL
jgi:hypothetical protein